MGAPSSWSHPSITWGEWYGWQMRTDWQSSGIWQRRRWFGAVWKVSWSGRGRIFRCQNFFQIRHPVGVSLRCGDVGGYPLNETGTGGLPGPGGTATHKADPAAESRRGGGVHIGGGGKGGGGVWANGDIHFVKLEYGPAIYCYTIAPGPLWGVG